MYLDLNLFTSVHYAIFYSQLTLSATGIVISRWCLNRMASYILAASKT